MFPDSCLLPKKEKRSAPTGPNVIAQSNAMGTLSFREQTASVDRKQEYKRWADVKPALFWTCGLGSPHHERLRAIPTNQ